MLTLVVWTCLLISMWMKKCSTLHCLAMAVDWFLYHQVVSGYWIWKATKTFPICNFVLRYRGKHRSRLPSMGRAFPSKRETAQRVGVSFPPATVLRAG